MIHSLSRACRDRSSCFGRLASGFGLVVAVLFTTAVFPGAARAGRTAATNRASVTIRVSVSPYYGLSRLNAHQTLRSDATDQLCVGSNHPVQSLPIKGIWVSGQQEDLEFVLPHCDPGSRAALRPIMQANPSGATAILVVRPD